MMERPAIYGGLFAFGQAIVAYHLDNVEPVVGEDANASMALGSAARADVAPEGDRVLVAEGRQRTDPVWVGETLEVLDRDGPVDWPELALKRSSKVQISLPLTPRRQGLEDDGDHRCTSGACGAETSGRNVRSSRVMKRSRLANAKFSRPSGSSRRRDRKPS